MVDRKMKFNQTSEMFEKSAASLVHTRYRCFLCEYEIIVDGDNNPPEKEMQDHIFLHFMDSVTGRWAGLHD